MNSDFEPDDDLPLSVEIGEGFGRDFDQEQEKNPRRSLRGNSGNHLFGLKFGENPIHSSIYFIVQICFYLN